MPPRAPLPVSVGVAAGVLGAVVLAGVHLVNAVTAQSRLLDMDRENNVPTWFSAALFLLAAVAALAAVGRSAHPSRIAWLVIAGLCAAFSADEVASVHEEAGRRLGAETTLSVAQPAAAAVVVLVLLGVAHIVRGRAARRLRLAAVVLVGSQTCATVAGLLTSGTGRFLLETVEDTTEMLTATALLAAALAGAGERVDLRPRSLAAELGSWWRGEGRHTVGDVRRPATARPT